jgi:serine/threonine protein kinase/tetratricopeptide (TPR) repeat protein
MIRFGTAMNDEVRLLFHELAELSPEEREQVLAQRHIEPEVRAEVESLLNHDSPTAQDFSACIAGAAGEMLLSAAGSDFGHCGPYRLVRLLGRGGMGAVYLGERNDGEIQQKVAVKLLGAESDRRGWRERFLKERQLLASLNHPSIVHVMDAGHTDDGRPFLIMEYVEGTPIDVYASRIPVRDRLMLILRVCEGLSHAHGRLIIHRDLKPTNILVDGAGQPKLLDFGIARLLAETAEATQTAERLFTPNYASPEQLRGEVQTTATDIYSLGAVLYKLLTGRSPHESDTHASQAIDVITGKKEIPPASRLNPDVSNDLDYIVRKALRTDPAERYASVEAFANDIHAFLESRPVEARAGNTWYRTRKYLRRYWVAVAAASLIVASLSTGLYVANRGRVIAEQRFRQLRQLSTKVFDLDKAIRTLPGSIQARQRLVAASLEYLEGFASRAPGDPDLALEIGEGYWRVARIQGVPVEPNLGEYAHADASLKKADELIGMVLAARPRDRTALLRSAAIAQDRMILAQEEHRNEDAQAYARQATEHTDTFLRLGGASDSEREEAAGTYGNVGLAYVNMHLYAQAIPCARRSVELTQPIPSARYRVGQSLSLLANALRYQGDLPAALQTIREARKVAEEAVYPDETVRRMFTMFGILMREGLILGEDGGVSFGRVSEAIEPLQKALDMVEEVARKDRDDATSRSRVGNAALPLGNILRHKDPQRALAVYDLAVRRLSEIRNSVGARRDQAMVLANSAYALRSLHRASEAEQRIQAASAILKETKDDPAEHVAFDSPAFIVLRSAADHDAEQGRLQRAVERYEQLHDKVSASKANAFNDLRDAPRLSRLYEALAQLYRRTGDTVRAESFKALRLELWRQWDRTLPNNAFVQRQLQAANLP